MLERSRIRIQSDFKPTTRFDQPKPNGKFGVSAESKVNNLTWKYFQNMTIPDFGNQLARQKDPSAINLVEDSKE